MNRNQPQARHNPARCGWCNAGETAMHFLKALAIMGTLTAVCCAAIAFVIGLTALLRMMMPPLPAFITATAAAVLLAPTACIAVSGLHHRRLTRKTLSPDLPRVK